jgi:hypothetical protein
MRVALVGLSHGRRLAKKNLGSRTASIFAVIKTMDAPVKEPKNSEIPQGPAGAAAIISNKSTYFLGI